MQNPFSISSPASENASSLRPPASLRRPQADVLLYRIWLDEAARLVRAEASGCWTVAETESYLAALTDFVTVSRSTFRKVRVLLDRRGVTSQSPEVAQRLADANGTIFEGDDKIALIVDSSLNKMGLRHRMPHGGTKAFLSVSAAETWLKV